MELAKQQLLEVSYHFKKAGKKVIIGAADTFRATLDQLEIWVTE